MLSCACPKAVCPEGPSAPAPAGGRPRWEIADVFRLYGEGYRAEHPLSRDQLKVMSSIERCRTSALGGHLVRCDACGYELRSHNTCRNRHCPKCQTLAKERWLQERQEELLPVGYFHLVCTLPQELNPLVLCNKRALLALLFTAVADTLQSLAHDPQWRLQGHLGFLAVLHTWSQTLIDHFHLHCLIPAGGTCCPPGFIKIRHFGFLANTCKAANLQCIRAQLGDSPLPQPPKASPETLAQMMLRITGEDISRCPRCRQGRLVRAAELPPLLPLAHREAFDTS